MKIQLAKSPCSPRYSVVVGDQELWDSDCASDSLEQTIESAEVLYPDEEIIGFDDPRHYSQDNSGASDRRAEDGYVGA